MPRPGSDYDAYYAILCCVSLWAHTDSSEERYTINRQIRQILFIALDAARKESQLEGYPATKEEGEVNE